jgi:hypothetical protein
VQFTDYSLNVHTQAAGKHELACRTLTDALSRDTLDSDTAACVAECLIHSYCVAGDWEGLHKWRDGHPEVSLSCSFLIEMINFQRRICFICNYQ